jgi:hypothetical protein
MCDITLIKKSFKIYNLMSYTNQELYDWLMEIMDANPEKWTNAIGKALRQYPERKRQLYRLTTKKQKTNSTRARLYRLAEIVTFDENDPLHR